MSSYEGAKPIARPLFLFVLTCVITGRSAHSPLGQDPTVFEFRQNRYHNPLIWNHCPHLYHHLLWSIASSFDWLSWRLLWYIGTVKENTILHSTHIIKLYFPLAEERNKWEMFYHTHFFTVHDFLHVNENTNVLYKIIVSTKWLLVIIFKGLRRQVTELFCRRFETLPLTYWWLKKASHIIRQMAFSNSLTIHQV